MFIQSFTQHPLMGYWAIKVNAYGVCDVAEFQLVEVPLLTRRSSQPTRRDWGQAIGSELATGVVPVPCTVAQA